MSDSGNASPPSNLRNFPPRRPASLRRQWRRWSQSNVQPTQKVTPLSPRRSQVSLPELTPRGNGPSAPQLPNPSEATPGPAASLPGDIPSEMPSSRSSVADFATRFYLPPLALERPQRSAPPRRIFREPSPRPRPYVAPEESHEPPAAERPVPLRRPEPLSRPTPSPVKAPSPAKAKARPSRPRSPQRMAERAPQRSPRPPLSGPARSLLYGARLLVLGVGMSAIAGTLLALRQPTAPFTRDAAEPAPQRDSAPQLPEGGSEALLASLDGSKNAPPEALVRALETAIADYPDLTLGVFAFDVKTGTSVSANASAAFPAASTIKLPIAVAVFQAFDRGTLSANELLTLKEAHIAGGSGDMEKDAPGTQYPALEVVRKAMAQSDNTATNILIDRLGGPDALNAAFADWGLEQTVLREVLPDLDGSNATTPEDLARLLVRLERGELLSHASRDRLLDIMSKTHNDTLLPGGVGEGALVSHKTGDIGSVLADAGLVDTASGQRYVLVAMVRRPRNDPRAADAIRDLSRSLYRYFESDASAMPSTLPATTASNASDGR